jgi:hypothetical protein
MAGPLGKSLDPVSRHSQDRPYQGKGGPVATERDEFLRAAWRITVAADTGTDRLEIRSIKSVKSRRYSTRVRSTLGFFCHRHWLSPAFGESARHAAYSARWRSRSNFARPYMLRLIAFSFVIWPSVCPFE